MTDLFPWLDAQQEVKRRKKKPAVKRPSPRPVQGRPPVPPVVARRNRDRAEGRAPIQGPAVPANVVSRNRRVVSRQISREIAADRGKPKKVDPVIARGDAIAARVAKAQKNPALEGKVRAAYTANPGDELLGGRLEQISRDADPLINFTEKVTRPLTTPATVAASLIDADPTNAIKQLVSASYWGRYRFPSEALRDRGALPGGPWGTLLGLGADVAPSFAVPGFKTAGRAAGSQAARAVSRGQDLTRNKTARVPVRDQEARLPGRPAPRPQRAVRRNPARGPDLDVNPNLRGQPTRPVPGGGATRSVTPRPRRTGRPIEDMPYYPSPAAQRAVEKVQRRRREYDEITAGQPTRSQVALAGQRLGRAQAVLAGVERATVGKIRQGPKPLPIQRTNPDKPIKSGPATKPKPVEVFVDSGSSSSRSIGGWRKAVQVGEDKVVVNLARPGTPSRWVVARKDVDSSDFYGGRPTDPRTPQPGEARIVYDVENGGPRGVISTHRTRAEALSAASSGVVPKTAIAPTRFTSRAPMLNFRTVSELRRSSVSPVEGGRALPRLRTRVKEATGKVEAVTRPGPTPKQVGKAGRRLEKAEAKLRELESRLVKPRKPAKPAKPNAKQTDAYRETFTGSREREWIEASMEYEAAFRSAVSSAPLGVNITLPFRYNSKGITIPFTSVATANKVRAAFSNGPMGEALTAYRVWLVSRYGPNEVVRHGAVAADDIVRLQSGRTARTIRDETRKAGLSDAELKLASHWLEGTVPKGTVVPQRVKDYARKMADLTERNFDEFVQAGGVVKRFGQKLEGGLERQYVYHLLPPGEWDEFAVSALARRQMLYGKRPGFTKHRDVLTIEDLKRAGFHPVERLDELTFARAMAHHRALAEMELTRSVARRFGRRVSNDRDIPDNWQRVPSQFVDEDVVVPKDVAQTLRNVIAARLALPGNKASQKAQQANQAWKEWTLFTAGHDIRNQIGDSALQFQRTMNPVAPLMALTFGAKTLTGKGKVGGKSDLTSAQAKRLAETGGMRDTGLLGGDVLSDVASVEAQGSAAIKAGGLRRPMRKVHSGVRTFRTNREGVNKAGIFTRELRRGEGAVHASRVAKDTVYDYADVGKAVNWARRSPIGAPFATWTAKNLPAQIRMAAQQPGQLSAIVTGIESLRQQTGGFPRFLMPDWFRDRVPIPIPGYGNTNVDLPVSSLNLIPTGSLGGGGSFMDTVNAWQSQLGPLLQVPIAAKGVDPLTGGEFRGSKPASRMEQFLQQFPVTAFFLGGPGDKVLQRDKDGNKISGPAAKDDFLSWVFRQFTPGLSTAGRLSGNESQSFLDSARGPLLGHTKRDFFDPVKLEAQLRSLDYEYTIKLGKLNKHAEALGVTRAQVRSGKPLPKQLRDEHNEILRIVAQGEWITEALRQTRGSRP